MELSSFLSRTFLFKIIKWLALTVLGLIVLLLLAMECFDRYITTDSGVSWLFRNVQREVVINRTENGVRYLSIGDSVKPALVLIHGAPGSTFDWKNFAKYEKIYDRYRLLIVDRPGYGATKPRGAEKSILKQAIQLQEVLKDEKQPAYILGHSYGAPIAVIMGALAPEKIVFICGVSGQYDPDNEITMQISHWLRFGVFKYMLPRWLWVSNVEKLSHPDAQRELMPYYEKVDVPVGLIHGDKDSLVPYENSPWLMNHLSNAKMDTWEGKDHAVHFTDTEQLVDYMLEVPY